MKRITIDKATFGRIVTTAIRDSVDVFTAMDVYLLTAERMIREEYIGQTLFENFDTLPEDVQEEAKKAICLEAFYIAIPFLDLVLTSTGFGIVSNTNVAPASKDRVASLSNQVKNSRDNALDGLLILLHELENDNWNKQPVAQFQIASLFWKAQDLRSYAGMPDAYRTDLLKLRPRISEAEEISRSNISSVYFDHLITSVRTNQISDDDSLIIMLLRSAIGAHLANSMRQFRALMDRIINTLEDNIEKYPVYQESEAYKVKHFEYYKNEQEDSTFFWG